jgi:AcrR family transcriptional regulator
VKGFWVHQPGKGIGKRGSQTRQRLIDSMLSLVNEGGIPAAASVRAIARRAGVTEAVLYRYFPNKEAMFREVWDTVLVPMVDEKRRLLECATGDPRAILRDWIRITYEHFDRDPAAFHYVFLSEGTAAWRQDPAYGVQGEIFGEWLSGVVQRDALGPLQYTRARDYFVSLLLSVPRHARAGDLDDPAVAHVDETLFAACRLFGL